MIHLILDTNIFRQDLRREKPEFVALRQLMDSGRVYLHIPEIIARELITHVQISYQEKLGSIGDKLRKAPKYALSNEQKQQLRKMAGEVEQIAKESAKKWESDFRAWVRRNAAEIHKVKPKHGVTVIDDYFNGRPPYSRIKNREDIPDAFIYQVLLEVTEQHGSTHFVANDGNLLKACGKVSGVETYATLDAFLHESGLLDQLKKEAEDAAFRKELVDRLRTGSLDELEERLRDVAYNGVMEAAPSRIVINSDEIDFEEVSDVDHIEFMYGEIIEYAVGLFRLPFNGVFEGIVTYDDFPDGWFEAHPEEDYEYLVSKTVGRDRFATGHVHGGLVEIGAAVDLQVSGYITIRIPIHEHQAEGIDAALSFVDIEFDKLTEFREY